MRRVYCDMCGEEINEDRIPTMGSFINPEGLLVSVIITAPKSADLCVECIVKILREGTVHVEARRSV